MTVDHDARSDVSKRDTLGSLTIIRTVYLIQEKENMNTRLMNDRSSDYRDAYHISSYRSRL